MTKKAPDLVTLWWPRVLSTDEKVDTIQIQGLSRNRHNCDCRSLSYLICDWPGRNKDKVGTGRSVWEEAHRMFKDKVSKIEKQEVEI